MNFPARAVEIVRALYTANPQNDEERRVHIQRTAEQLCFELGPSWGNKKRAGLGDEFRSPDTLAFKNADGTCDLWDVQASSGAILVGPDQPPAFANVPPGDATFMPVQPVNHLGAAPSIPNPGTPPPTPGTPVDLGPVLAAFAELKGLIQQVLDKPAPVVTVPPFPVYRGNLSIKYLGNAAIELKPEAK